MSSTRSRGRAWLGHALWFAAGLLLAYLILGEGPARRESQQVGSTTVWTCRMHPQIAREEPGECPICGMTLVPADADTMASGGTDGGRRVLFYRHPMDPSITSPVPAKDEMGMDYVPVYEGEAEGPGSGPGTIRVDPSVLQMMNVQSVPVERRDLAREIRTVGYLELDPGRMVSVTTKYSGFVEEVYANYVGEPVLKGEPLFEIYSPELLQTEQELLSAVQYRQRLEAAPEEARRRAQALVEAARTRLRYWDISPEQIAELEESGEVFRTLRVVAPASGVIMRRAEGLEGMAVRPGMDLLHLADLSTLWLSVEIFEHQVAWIDVGTPAEVTFTYFPGETFRGVVRFIEPELSQATRTLRVKLEVPNPTGRLRSGMFATVLFRPVAARQVLSVPSLAVLRTGQRNVVVLDLGEGRFTPREVALGHQGSGWVEVLAGLEEGERVVTSAQFLLDSEASLQEAIRRMRGPAREPAAPEAPPGATGQEGGHAH
jgi:RND family efflux transporter MFP subunit